MHVADQELSIVYKTCSKQVYGLLQDRQRMSCDRCSFQGSVHNTGSSFNSGNRHAGNSGHHVFKQSGSQVVFPGQSSSFNSGGSHRSQSSSSSSRSSQSSSSSSRRSGSSRFSSGGHVGSPVGTVIKTCSTCGSSHHTSHGGCASGSCGSTGYGK